MQGNSSLKKVVLAGLFAALTALLAQISIPIPFSPVPITLQVFAVCMAGAILGSKYGALSLISYILLGACGLPVFSGFNGGPGIIAGPKGGYILSFPLMALVTGAIIEKSKRSSRYTMMFAMTAGLVICYSLGTTWLALELNLDFVKAIVMGIGWFLPLDILKIIVAASLSYNIRNALIKTRYYHSDLI